jgi:hypothetical protein
VLNAVIPFSMSAVLTVIKESITKVVITYKEWLQCMHQDVEISFNRKHVLIVTQKTFGKTLITHPE